MSLTMNCDSIASWLRNQTLLIHFWLTASTISDCSIGDIISSRRVELLELVRCLVRKKYSRMRTRRLFWTLLDAM